MPLKQLFRMDEAYERGIILVEIFGRASKCCLLFPFPEQGRIFFIGLFCNLVPGGRQFVLSTILHEF